MKILTLVTAAIAAILAPQARLDSVAQTPHAGFEVVSVKRNTYTQGITAPAIVGGRLTVTGWTVRDLVKLAYASPGVEVVVDGPGWINSDRFDIVAKTSEGKPAEMSMLQSVLVERFKVRVRTESVERPIYELIVASKDGKLGPQLRASTCTRPDLTASLPASATTGQARAADVAACVPSGQTNQYFRIGAGPAIIAEGMTMPELAAALKNFPVVDRLVQDRTELTGAFDFRMQWVPGGPALDPNAGPDLFTALHDQLGLKLERAKSLVSVIILDHVEPPTED